MTGPPTPTARIEAIDSHTGGEPTRVLLTGFPALAGDTVAAKRDDMTARFHAACDDLVGEPRGSEPMVGALLVEPAEAGCVAGVIFFDRSGPIGMCGHGMIGLIATLRHLGRIRIGRHRIDTAVGVVEAELHDDGTVSIANVPSRRLAARVELDVPGVGPVTGDVAFGGNTFFLVTSPEISLDGERADLLRLARDVQSAAHAAGYDDVDHVEIFGDPTVPAADSRSFVRCPSGTYDRSPCGTGTSAKIACLAAAGTLAEGETWVQESITGSTFTASYRWLDRATGEIAPTITGDASVLSEATLLVDSPWLSGITA
jgi:4-hydroxyproline epimerase